MIDGESWARLEKRFLPSEMRSAQHLLIEEISSRRWDYVVFIVRRSFLFGILTAKSMGVDLMRGARCLTDSSFFVHIAEIARYYERNKSFPYILFADDFIYKGRNLNILLSHSEQLICDELKVLLKDDYNEDAVCADFRRAVSIKVCARVRGQNLLINKYRECLSTYTEISIREWHKISSDEGLMLMMADTANASYTYSVRVDEKTFRRIERENPLIRTTYLGNREYVLVDIRHNEQGEVKYVCTIRFIRVLGMEHYRMIAFVLTPELKKDTRKKIISELCGRISGEKDYSGLEKFLSSDNKIYKRSQDEWISSFFACAILNDFGKRYGIRLQDNEETLKLLYNYRRERFEKDGEVKKNLCACVNNPVFASISELKFFLDRTIASDEKVTVCVGEDALYGEQGVRRKLEELYYCREISELSKIVELAERKPFVIGPVDGKTQFPAWLPIDMICGDGGYEDVRFAMAYFLQMMDVGIHGVYAEDKRMNSSESYNPYSKAAEMSLIIYPMRLYRQMAVIVKSYEYCKRNFIDFAKHIDQYAQNSYCDIADKVDQIKEFVAILDSIGETPLDWSNGFFYRMDDFDPDDNNKNIDLLNEKELQDKENLTNYQFFIESK